MRKEDLDLNEVKSKYSRRLAKDLGDSPADKNEITTRDYENFKKTFLPKNLGFYEKWCNIAEGIIPIKPDAKAIPKIQEAIKISHLDISPTGTYSFAVLASFAMLIVFILTGYVIPVILTGGESADTFFFVFFGILMSIIMLIPFTKLPFIISNFWRMKASNQMVLSIFYIVTFMRHTPNLELAIDFAAEHLKPPLSLDFKKVVWNIETSKYDNVTQSLDNYLETWREYNPEFIEAMHLIESSLYENDEARRQSALDKSLEVILDETFEKMLHFTHDLKGPITTLHMLGIILPILGLVILPLIIAFVPEAEWYHLFAIYNVALPMIVYYMGRNILSTRPTGYGGVDSSGLEAQSEANSIVIKFSGNDEGIRLTPLAVSIIIFTLLMGLAISPLVLNYLSPGLDYALTDNGLLRVEDIDSRDTVYGRLLDYRPVVSDGANTGDMDGPFGLGSSLISLAIPLAIGFGVGHYNKTRTGNLVNVRERTKVLEKEFASALFQLGNRLGDGIPAEIAFGNVAEVMQGTTSGKFFELASNNVVKMGLSAERAVFDPDVGALREYPSSIIESSMKVFLESSRKGPQVASQALITVAEYIKNMHRVDERLQDLMADIISNMQSQISFLTPAISGIVVGITSMISQILGSLGERLDDLGDAADQMTGGSLIEMFGSGGIPTYFFQAIVGLYVVQITYILSIIINGIQNGTDKVGEADMLGSNMINSALLYSVIAGLCTVIFSVIASTIVSTL